MWDYNLMSALQTVEKTMGFVLHRWLVFLAVAGGFLFATVAGAGTAVGIGSLSSNALAFGHFGAIASFAAFGFLVFKLRRTLYLSVRLPHLLLLKHICRAGQTLPEGRAQLNFARAGIAEQTVNRATVWEIRQSAAAVMSDWTAHLRSQGSEATRLSAAITRLLALRAKGDADLVVTELLDHPGANAWQTARDTLLRLAKNSALLEKNGLTLIAFEAVGWLLAYLLLLLGFQKIAAALPFPAGYWPHVFAFLFGWNIKASFLEPTVQAALLQVPLKPVDPEEADVLAETLAGCSPAFRDVEERARQ